MKSINVLKNLPVEKYVEDLTDMQISLWADGDSLRYKAPAGVMTKELLDCLKNRKSEILEYLSTDVSVFHMQIGKAPEKQYYPLSPAQLRMFILNRVDKGSTAYNLTQVLSIKGDIDKTRFHETVKQLTDRHDSLRTSFELIDGKPVQRVHNNINFEIDYEEAEEKNAAEIIKDFIRPYDLSRLPLFRFKLVKLSDQSYILIQDMHHIISDGVSEAIMVKEINELFTGVTPPELKIQYKDFVYWNEKLLDSREIKLQKEFWLNKLGSDIPLLNMQTDFTRPHIFSFKGDTVKFKIGKELSLELNKLARAKRVTLFTVLLSAYSVLLYKYTGQNDMIIGTPVAGRRHADIQNVVGVFINTLALRLNCKPETGFSEYLSLVSGNLLEAFENQDYPFANLVDDLNIKRDMSRNPVFDTLFILQNMSTGSIRVEGLEISAYDFNREMAQLDITVEAVESEEGISLDINYYTGLFKRETIESLGTHFTQILMEVSKDPDIKLCDIEMLTEEEREMILHSFNNTKTNYKKDKTIHELIEEQADMTPDNTALEFGDRLIKYWQLNAMSNRIAAVLREKGIKRNDIVGIMVKRSPEMIAGILGIMKAGGAYLPIDPVYPKDRIGYMIKDSSTNVLLTTSDMKNKLEPDSEFVFLDEMNLSQADEQNLKNINDALDLAYVIYTSGSTGNPKGVMIQHRALNNFIKGMTDKIGFCSEKSILALTTICFDIFALETHLPLTMGMKIIIADEEEQMNMRQLGRLISGKQPDMIQMTPSRMQLLLESREGRESIKNVKDILIGGEAFPENLSDKLSGISDFNIYNVYGPTECTVWSTVKDLTGLKEINVGKPIANTQIYILNTENRIVPLNSTGELCIGGDGLSKGYLNRAELTAEKFIKNPYTGELIYKTGDLAKWLPNGEIQVLGRLDHQVKIRGYRIEPGEIESRIIKYESINDCVVSVKDDSTGSKQLIAYYIAEEQVNVRNIRAYLLASLPEYMIPAYFIKLDKFPMTPNGKIDKKLLPQPAVSRSGPGSKYLAPKTETEKMISEIWKSLMEIDKVSLNDNFFEIGGNSLLAIRMECELEKENIEFQFSDIEKYPVLTDFAGFIDGKENQSDNSDADFSQQEPVLSQKLNILENIEPFNEIIYRGCFFSAFFPVVLSYKKSIIPYFVNDVGIYDYIDDENYRRLDIKYYSEESLNNLAEMSGVHVRTEIKCNNLINSIKEAVTNNSAVIVCIDCFYSSIRPDTYMKRHWPHSLLVYGFNDENKTFNILEHRNVGSLIYEKREISFSDLENSYNGYLENFKNMDIFNIILLDDEKNIMISPNKGEHPSYFELKSVESKLTREDSEKLYFHNMIKYKTEKQDSLKLLKDFRNEFEAFISDETILKENTSRIMQSVIDVINDKKAEHYKVSELLEENSGLSTVLDDSIEKWIFIRTIVGKYLFSGKYKKDSFDLCLKKLDDIINLDILFYDKLFKLIEEKI